MEAKDLRVGNYIFCVPDRIEVVKDIMEHYVEVENRCKSLDYCKYAFIEGIPLSAKVLEAAGFEKWGIHYKNAIYYISTTDRGETWRFATYNECLCNLTYLHQLQNLYFALTQKELSIAFNPPIH